MESKQIPLKDIWPVMKEQIDVGKTVVFSPKGTSMLPLIRQNIDKVILTKAPQKLKKYDLPLYLRKNGQFVLHRVVGIDKNGYIMCGDNQSEREYGIKDEQILALACGLYRENDYISFDDKKYVNYCKKQVLKKRIYGIYLRFRRFAGRIKHKITDKKK
ncbi:MAG: hypothetical protein K5768_04585 [Firmicutes bacterium]|nr:hypothetical protein [Bacillota bacterium]